MMNNENIEIESLSVVNTTIVRKDWGNLEIEMDGYPKVYYNGKEIEGVSEILISSNAIILKHQLLEDTYNILEG